MHIVIFYYCIMLIPDTMKNVNVYQVWYTVISLLNKCIIVLVYQMLIESFLSFISGKGYILHI